MIKMHRCLPLPFLLVTLCNPLRADIILMRNGTKLIGMVTGQDRREIRFVMKHGIRIIPKRQIKRISYGPTEQEEKQQKALQERLAKAKEIKDPEKRVSEMQKILDEEKRIQEEIEKRKQLITGLSDEITTLLQREEDKIKEEERRLEQQKQELTERKKRLEEQRKHQEELSRRSAEGGVDRLGPAWRSAVLPGWGQYRKGADGKAFFFGISFVGAAAYRQSVAQKYNNAGADYSLAAGTSLAVANPQSSSYFFFEQHLAHLARDEKAAQAALARNSSFALAALYLWNVLDAAFVDPEPLSANPGEHAGVGKLGSFWRSALIPGWGQVAADRPVKGTVLTAGTLIMGALYLDARHKYNTARKDYQNSVDLAYLTPFSSDYAPAVIYNYTLGQEALNRIDQNAARTRNIGYLLGGLYLFNLADLFIFAPGEALKPWRDKWGSAWRAAVLPGWGHAYQGSMGRGMIFTVSLLALGGYGRSQQLEYYRARDEHTVAVNSVLLTPADNAYTGLRLANYLRVQDSADRAAAAGARGRYSALAFFLVYGYNVFDAYHQAATLSSVARAPKTGGAVEPSGNFRLAVLPERSPVGDKTGTFAGLSYQIMF